VNRWRLEWLRLVRTGRWIALGAVFLLLGFGEPLATRYLGQLLSTATGAGNIHITVSSPQPADAMRAYFNNIPTLGTLVAVVIAALAFAVRANPPLAALYLTHVPGRIGFLFPRLLTIVAATTLASVAGGAAAAYETTVLIGAPTASGTVAGILASALGTVFAVTLTFLTATLLRGQVATIAVALGATLVVVPFTGLIPGIANTGPAAFSALPTRLQLTPWNTDATWATAVTLLLAAACVTTGFWRATRWEL